MQFLYHLIRSHILYVVLALECNRSVLMQVVTSISDRMIIFEYMRFVEIGNVLFIWGQLCFRNRTFVVRVGELMFA